MPTSNSFWRQFNPRSSSVWRLTLSFALISFLILSLAVVIIYQLLLGEQTRQVERRLNAEKVRIESLAKGLNQQDFSMQLGALREKTDVLIFWQEGLEQGQALSFLPDEIPMLPNTVDFPVLDTQRGQIRLLTAGVVRSDYGTVVVATATEHLNQLIVGFQKVATWTLCISFILTCLMGYVFARRHLHRVRYINHTVEQVQNGDLSARLVHRKQGDEFDRLSQHINTMLETVEENFKLVQGITDNIAHDLKTPLTRVRLQLEQQLEHNPELGGAQENLDSVLSTFDAMLKLTRLEHGQHPLNLVNVQWQHLLDDAIELVQPTAAERGQTITLEVAENSQVMGDKSLLFQGVYNLLTNAIKYAPEHTVITVSVNNQGVSVQNQATDLDALHMQKLTQRFYRGDPARHTQGFGLGLATVKAICQRHQFVLSLDKTESHFIASIKYHS